VLKRQLGFTLLEIMVVMALVAFATTTIVLTIPNTQQLSSDKNQKEVFARLLRGLAQTAIQDQQWYGVYFTKSTYQAVTFNNKQWLAVQKIPAHEFEGANAFSLLIDDKDVVLKDTTLIELDHIAAQSTEIEGTETKEHTVNAFGFPHIQVSPTGLVSSFELRLVTEQEIVVLKDPYAFN
jgi:general secretion pathway protein H